ncbi:MAG: hypothetical protein JNJ50_19870 [Acidobacteria bacterium]|nr:hypothetical protein [Acidobacteriota bacterium]
MIENRISASLTQADVDAILAAINTIKQRLPFLIHLSPEERRSLPRPGDKSRAFIHKALEVAHQNPDILPRMFNVEEMRKDVELSEALQPIGLALTQLWEQFENTSIVINSEAYAAALAVYSLAKATGKSASLNDTLDELSKRFARKVPAKAGKEPAK